MSILDREAWLDQGARAVGARWAQGWCDDMRREGRTVSGGWPGTVPEARALVVAHFDLARTRRGEAPLSAPEIASATRTAYTTAKREWLSHNTGRDEDALSPPPAAAALVGEPPRRVRRAAKP